MSTATKMSYCNNVKTNTGGGKNLIICTTPLQVLIAERIVALHPQDRFCAMILVAGEQSAKLKLYGERLIERCGQGFFMRDAFYGESPRALHRLYLLARLKCKFYCLTRGIKALYVSSYEKIPVRTLIGTLGQEVEIYSFDDGLMNLNFEAYQDNKVDWRSRFFGLFDVVMPSQIQKRIAGHYTIYDAPNAASPTPERIELFNLSDEVEGGSKEKPELVRICLGQPIFELDEQDGELSKEATQTLISVSGSTYYLPHPRENYRIERVTYIDTPLIAEDYILQDLKQYPNRHYEIASFFSTVLINLVGHPRITLRSYKPHNLPKRWESAYNILEQFGIPITPL